MAEIHGKEITNPERIRRIIGILRLDGREIEVHIPQYIEVAKIADTTQEVFTVHITDSFMDLHDENISSVYINFVFSGVELFGQCNIAGLSASTLTLDYPMALESRSKRRYPRVKLSRMITAKLKLKQIPEKEIGKITSKDIPVKYSKLYWEVQRESVDIKKVFLLVGTEVRKFSPYSEIILFNKSNLQMRDARILRKAGKVLYVDDCRKIQSYTRFIPSDKIISYSYYLNEKKLQGAPKDEIIDELKEILRENLSQGLISKALAPIFSKNEVIGAIRVVYKEKDKRISFEILSDIMSLSALLTMAIEKAKFIPDLGDAVQSDLLEISEGGLYLRIGGSSGEVTIQEGMNVEVKFLLNDQEVTLRGNVLRRDEQTKSYAVGLVDMESQNRKAVKKFVENKIEELKKKKDG